MVASTRPYLEPGPLAQELGLTRWQIERADTAGILPPRGHSRGWLPEQLDGIHALLPVIVKKVGTEPPIGAARCADRLASRLKRDDVLYTDIESLAEAGLLTVVDTFYPRKGGAHELFAPAAIDALTVEQVDAVIAGRKNWTAATVTFEQALTHLGWKREDLLRVVADRNIPRGRYQRFQRADIDALAADQQLCEQVRVDRVLTADQAAAEVLDVARRHFDICVEAGWIRPQRHHEKLVGRYRTVEVPLYRTGDVERLLDRPEVNWARVRETPKGERSPLLDVVGGRAPSRAEVIRAFLRDFGAQHSIEMWAWWVPGPDVWEVDWERIEGGPTKSDVVAAIQANPVVHRYLADMQLNSAAGAAIRFARAMLEPDVAVILDTETVSLGGPVCEIAVIDACTGKTLLDTLVNPGVPIEQGAFAVHGISDSEVTAPGIPDWPTVYKRLLRVTKDRIVLAYNADYDRRVIAADCGRHGIRRSRLAKVGHWSDVMVPRSDHAHSRRWLRNGGGHRALGDVQQTRQHLLRMTAP
jgi:DNA polymerase III epsilon subunit-like protein